MLLKFKYRLLIWMSSHYHMRDVSQLYAISAHHWIKYRFGISFRSTKWIISIDTLGLKMPMIVITHCITLNDPWWIVIFFITNQSKITSKNEILISNDYWSIPTPSCSIYMSYLYFLYYISTMGMTLYYSTIHCMYSLLTKT